MKDSIKRMETELEAAWATVEQELAGEAGVRHPWRQNDVEPPSFPPHATDELDASDTVSTNTSTHAPTVGPPPFLSPTAQLSCAKPFSALRNNHRPRRRRYHLPSVATSSPVSPSSPACNGEAAAGAVAGKQNAAAEAVSPTRTVDTAWVDFLDTAWRTMNYINDGAEFTRSVYNAAWDAAGAVWRALTSKTARRTLFTTALVSLASAFLFGLACLGYLAFYHEYLPDQVTTLPVHLQYGYELNPYGVVSLADVNLKDYQDYDISVTLKLPRSPANLERGNFMVALHLLDNKSPFLMAAATNPLPVPGPQSVLEGRNILHTSTRPAILPYTDPLVSLASRVLFLAYHVFFPTSETTRLVVPLVEKLEFRPYSMNPTSLVLDVQAGQTLQVYSVLVTITAQLQGLRWFMHTYWITSFVLFTTLFWLCELFFAGMAVLFLGLVLGGGGGDDGKAVSQVKKEEPTIKQETEGKTLEDVPMTFPTSSRQPPLRYDPEPSISEATPQADFPPAAAGGEADDEDDEDEEGYETRFHDSGIGTSYSERDTPGSVRRRTSRGRGHN